MARTIGLGIGKQQHHEFWTFIDRPGLTMEELDHPLNLVLQSLPSQ